MVIKLKYGIDDYIVWAKYYLENPGISMSQVADNFGVSKKTIQNAMKKIKILGEGDNEEMRKLAVAIEQNKNANLAEGSKKGGQNGKPTSNGKKGGKRLTISSENLEKYADRIINGDLSLRELSSSVNIARSTLHANLTTRITDKDQLKSLQQVLESHKPGNKPVSGKSKR